MGWQGVGCRRYYTRSRRVGGRVVREYVGGGTAGEAAAAADALLRDRRRALLEAERALRRRWLAAEAASVGFVRAVSLLLAAALEANGYHRHARGQWRKRRMDRDVREGGEGKGAAGTHAGKAVDPPGGGPARPDPVAELVARVRAGEAGALAEWRRALALDPALGSRLGDLAGDVRELWVGHASGGDPARAEAVRDTIRRMRAELVGDDPSPLEGLLADRVVVSWLQVNYAEAVYGRPDGVDRASRAWFDARASAAQQRHLQAIRALATALKLLRRAPSPADLLARLEGAGRAARSGLEALAGGHAADN